MNDLYAWYQAVGTLLRKPGFPGQDGYLDALRENLPRIFRYHLAWTGNPERAQELTEKTGRLALRWRNTYRSDRAGLDAWFFGLARFTRSERPGRGASHPRVSGDEDPIELPERALLAQLSTFFTHLPASVAEALVLAFFARLSHPEIGLVLGIKAVRIRDLIAQGVKKLQDFLLSGVGSQEKLQEEAIEILENLLARSPETFQPDPVWLAELTGRLSPSQPALSSEPFSRLAGPFFRRAFSLRRVVVWGLRLVPAALALILIIYLGLINRSGLFPSDLENTSTPLPQLQLNSTDFAFWAGQDGVVYRYSLAKNTLQALTEPGAYTPGLKNSSGETADPPVISPDGRWLVLHQAPSGTEQVGMLFIDLENPVYVAYMRDSARLVWSPDGSQAAWYQTASPRHVFTLAPPFKTQPVDLAVFSEDLVALAWSPDGSQIAALTTEAAGRPLTLGGATQPARKLNLYTVLVSTGEIKKLTAFTSYSGWIPDLEELVWTADGKEIWDSQLRIAVDVASRGSSLLVSNPESEIPPVIQAYLLRPSTSPYRFSPDGKWIANLQGLNPTVSLMAVKDASHPRWVSQLDQASLLDWTAESTNLLAGNTYASLGPVYRLDATTGASMSLAQDVYWIGVGSSLQSRSHGLAPQNKAEVIEAGSKVTWPCHAFAAELDCVPIPGEWKLIAQNGSNVLGDYGYVLTNLDFASDLGWTSLRWGMIDIQIDYVFGPVGYLPQAYPADQQGITWNPFNGPGSAGIHVYPTDAAPGMNLVFFPTYYGVFYWHILSQSAYDNLIVQTMLWSVKEKIVYH